MGAKYWLELGLQHCTVNSSTVWDVTFYFYPPYSDPDQWSLLAKSEVRTDCRWYRVSLGVLLAHCRQVQMK